MTRVVIALLLAGCSSAPYGGDPLPPVQPEHGARSADTTNDTDDSDPAPSSAKSTTSTKGTGPCAGETTAQACLDCCSARSPDALAIYSNAYSSCLCTAPGPCKDACATTYCTGAKPDAACKTCMESAAQCDDAALDACDKDTSCAPLLVCADDSKCASKS